jgi:ABC-type transport system involved in cytochrome bd biosynthesis fused ATPase/permease subunit
LLTVYLFVKGKAEDMMQSTKDTTNAAKNKTTDAAQSAKDMTANAAQSAKDKTADATQSTKESAQQGKDQSAGFLQQVFYLYPSLIIKIYDRLCVYVYAIWFGASQCYFCLVTDRGTGDEHGSGRCGQCEEHTWNG